MILASLQNSIVVSVQAEQGEPLNTPECLLALAQSAVQGGAKGLRIANPENIRLIKEKMPEVPVIGLTKPLRPPADPMHHVYITPSLWAAEAVAKAGADIVAMDATRRSRPMGESLPEIVSCFRERFPGTLLMADIATLSEAEHAVQLGFDLIGTTLSGYTEDTASRKNADKPDFELLQELTKTISLPIVLEGRVWEKDHVHQAFALGAFAVVIGSAITRPHWITRRFVDAIPV